MENTFQEPKKHIRETKRSGNLLQIKRETEQNLAMSDE
jgi:hypothetical protein